MTKAEAFNLAAQLNWDLPKTNTTNALIDMCLERGYNLGIDSDSADWVICDDNDKEIARCQ